MRANTICCIVELALNFFEQNLPLPCGAVTFDHSMSANKRMSFRSVITQPDSHFWVERANRCGLSCLQRIPDNRCEIIDVVTADGHQNLPHRSGRVILELTVAFSQWCREGRGPDRSPVRASSKSRNNDRNRRSADTLTNARPENWSYLDLRQICRV